MTRDARSGEGAGVQSLIIGLLGIARAQIRRKLGLSPDHPVAP